MLVRPSVVTSSLVTAALVTGCGSRWPQHAPTLASSELRAPVRTIDLLPADLEVWTHPDVTDDPHQIRLAAESRLVGVVSETIYNRGYSVGAVLDWDGRYVGPDGTPQVALRQPQLLATIDSLASYGTNLGSSRSLPDPILPAPLDATGADATLYVGGWGFAGKEPEYGKLAGKIIFGTILVAVAVIIVVALVTSTSKSRSKSKFDSAGRSVGGAGRAGASIGRAAMRAGSAMGRGRATLDEPEPLVEPAVEVALAGPQRPVWSSDKSLPRTGRPKMYLEMTLIDNRSGRVLWHAHQAFPANPARPNEVMKAAKLLLASLPPA